MKKASLLILALLLSAPVLSLHAAVTAVDCSKKTLKSAIEKLDKSASNTLNISGNCTEDVVVSGFNDLTLIGAGGASITATGAANNPPTGTALLVNERSRITVQTLTLNGGEQGALCTGRSGCVFRNVTIQGGGNGISAQDQSGVDILGASVIQNSRGTGVGVYGASTVNIRPDPWVTLEEAGPVISGHAFVECDPLNPADCWNAGVGAQVQDGSFLRADNSTFSGNGVGIVVQRNAVIKIYSTDQAGFVGGVINNVNNGINVQQLSLAAVIGRISGNGGAGIRVGPLGVFTNQGVTFSGNNPDVVCTHVTAISQPPTWCGH